MAAFSQGALSPAGRPAIAQNRISALNATTLAIGAAGWRPRDDDHVRVHQYPRADMVNVDDKGGAGAGARQVHARHAQRLPGKALPGPAMRRE